MFVEMHFCLEKEALCISQVVLTTCKTIQYHNPEDPTQNFHCHETKNIFVEHWPLESFNVHCIFGVGSAHTLKSLIMTICVYTNRNFIFSVLVASVGTGSRGF